MKNTVNNPKGRMLHPRELCRALKGCIINTIYPAF